MRQRLTRDRLIEETESGSTVRQIAEKYGLTDRYVHNLRSKFGLSKSHPAQVRADDQSLRAMMSRPGATPDDIAELLGLTLETVRTRLRKIGLIPYLRNRKPKT